VQRRKRKAQDYRSLDSDEITRGRNIEGTWDVRLPTDRITDGNQSAVNHSRHDINSEFSPGHLTLQPEEETTSIPASCSRETFQAPGNSSNSTVHDDGRASESSSFDSGRLPAEGASQFDVNQSENPDTNNAEASSEDSSWLYHEPWSCMSVCSEIGSNWIQNMTGSREFASVAKRCSQDYLQRSSPDNYLLTAADHPKTSEPTAWEYVEGKSKCDALSRLCTHLMRNR